MQPSQNKDIDFIEIKMERDLVSYVQVLKGWYHPDACKQTIEELNQSKWNRHSYNAISDPEPQELNGERELSVSYGENISTLDYLNGGIVEGSKFYLNSINLPWYTENDLNGNSKIRFNRYDENCLMNSHCDHIVSLFNNCGGIPILTALGILNEDYEGGEFVMFESMKLHLGVGDLVIFPSNFLYPHKVNPVKSGKRYSFVSWLW